MALTRLASALGNVNMGHFIPDYTAYEELLSVFKAFSAIPILLDAEALCDRVGVIHQGELRGVGAVAELTSQTQGKVEIIFYAQTVPAGLTSLGAEARVSGDLEGRAQLVLARTAGGTAVDVGWEMAPRSRAMQVAALFARPLLRWSHEWVLARGLEQFRRNALTGEEKT